MDLDDTLWPILPTLLAAEQALHAHLSIHFPTVASQFPPAAMRQVRDQIALENPHLQHDFSLLRILSLRHTMLPFGASEADVQRAFEVLFTARHQVQLFPGVEAALSQLAQRWPLIAVSNGNAELKRIGLDRYFIGQVSAREFGAAKPEPGIFIHACERLKVTPNHVLHIGDHAEQDVLGALRAGLMAAWNNETDTPWPHLHQKPHFRAQSLTQLAAQLR